ncbi:sperm acrosome membrane-associated protein 4-like [Carcharodon carcharias]|uniref:sperm acrosome membrane-associated protein 4-like n=1 Tax=Carcharodon carcharias TaxID=13397 RepID=UPI001B7E7351|nr:sperm acrosome membrane-associated protein 4-like [Carcharodon carcharias]
MKSVLALSIFLLFLAVGETLMCYTCIFPSLTKRDCLKFPRMCQPTETCLLSRAVGKKGSQRLVLYEKGCAPTSLCGVCGTKTAMGIVFTYNNTCCSSDLCNQTPGVTPSLALSVWPAVLLTLGLSSC